MKILIIKTGAFGDVLRTSVILEGLKEKYPDSKIYWLTSIDANPLLENNPFIQETYFIEQLNKKIFSEYFDLIISLEEDLQILLILEQIS